MTARVSVIVPTMAESARRESLVRAIDSIQSQAGVEVEPIVVVNGNRKHASILDALQQRGLRILELAEGNLPAAIRAGREAVTGAYFSFLDDDDIYLPDALRLRLEALQSRQADLAVGNGVTTAGRPLIADAGRVESDPLRALVEGNWLASCSGLYRTETMGAAYFDSLVKYFEWTDLALRLLMAQKRLVFVDRLTFCLSDTEGSASKQQTPEAIRNAFEILEHMLCRVPPGLRTGLLRKRAALYHDASAQYLLDGRLTEAWRMHLTSIFKGGWRYFSYTRHLARRTSASWMVG